MAYASLMVHMDIDQPNEARLKAAENLAKRLGPPAIIGIAACDQSPPPYFGDTAFVHKLVEEERARLTQRMAVLKDDFQQAMAGHAKAIEWRCALTSPVDYVVRHARAADLIITGPSNEALLVDPFRYLDASTLILQAGRPVLIVPPMVEWLDLKAVLVAWKDTREARRAVLDALPLLRAAQEVLVVEVLEGGLEEKIARGRVDDVANWLGRHGVNAATRIATPFEGIGDQLDTIAGDIGAGLIVTGAYGHNRLREWVFGGVTETLLRPLHRCVLLSH